MGERRMDGVAERLMIAQTKWETRMLLFIGVNARGARRSSVHKIHNSDGTRVQGLQSRVGVCDA